MFDRGYYRSLSDKDLIQHSRNDANATEREIALADALDDADTDGREDITAELEREKSDSERTIAGLEKDILNLEARADELEETCAALRLGL